ncbi:MAG: hypothetical protein KJO25_00870 [Bacteroidia bacterium]|nr:hypothetical protein [Bacteroidia bacterium]
MEKIFIIGFIILFSINVSAQSNSGSTEVPLQDSLITYSEYEVVEFSSFTDMQDFLVLRKVEPISSNPYDQTKMINYQKSEDIISIKAYMRALQIKGKVTRMS